MDRSARLPPFKAIEAFVIVARSQSFSRAAAALFVTQSAVTRRVQTLEAALGVQLLNRSTTAVNLTREGQAYLREAEAAIDALHMASAVVRRPKGRRRVVLRVAPSLAIGWLAPLLETFDSEAADIELHLDIQPFPANLSAENVDFMICFGVRPDWAGLAAEPIAPADVYVLASPKLAATLNDDPRAALSLHRPIELNGFETLWRSWRDGYGIDLSHGLPPLTLDSLVHCHEAAVHGLGLALGSDIISHRWTRSGALVEPFNCRVPLEASFYLVSRAGSRRDPAFAAVLQWLRRGLTVEPAPQRPSRAPGEAALAYAGAA